MECGKNVGAGGQIRRGGQKSGVRGRIPPMPSGASGIGGTK